MPDIVFEPAEVEEAVRLIVTALKGHVEFPVANLVDPESEIRVKLTDTRLTIAADIILHMGARRALATEEAAIYKRVANYRTGANQLTLESIDRGAIPKVLAGLSDTELASTIKNIIGLLR
jgi:hypothetical protein